MCVAFLLDLHQCERSVPITDHDPSGFAGCRALTSKVDPTVVSERLYGSISRSTSGTPSNEMAFAVPEA